jgi:hypothetical protein
VARVAGGLAGLVSSVVLVILSRGGVEGKARQPVAIFPDHPALFSMTLASWWPTGLEARQEPARAA